MRKITVSDYTLRKLSDNGASQLLFREKLAIALCIDRYGADVIELPAVKNPKEDQIIYKTISESVKNAAIAIPVGMTADSVKVAAECVKGAAHPVLQVSVPVSTVQMEYLYRMKGPKMIEKITELCKAARALCETVEFNAIDATRCDLDFLVQAAQTAKVAGATSVSICDDAGVMMPEEFAQIVDAVKRAVDMPVVACVSDSISLGAANALAAIKAGADGIKASVSGKDCLNLDSFAEALKTKADQLDVSCGLKFTEIHSDIDSMLKKINKTKEEEDLTLGGSVIFLDKESTIEQVSDAVRSLGYDLSEDDNSKVYEALMRLCEKKSSIGSKELEAIVASSAMQVPATYTLDSFVITISNLSNSVANINLSKDDATLQGVAVGDGPIDAAFKAIEQCIGFHYELDEFQIQAVTEGKEALGSALVRLRSNGKLYSGNGLSTDIVGASIRAYVNALNKIVYEENQR